ncbi:hypothetical protein CERSUDRAFT_117451 [Gelatoporia subvermispora B]|uniref:Uncharacterized protein n=1 Tax=Ceriporiopsis subvermispora (strain B) TaxID=914234 RepID=M2QAI3_CERS8|nr:hypothetical protein CERSUDRAFT_117451 [Gelatoporia subvermispora B]
MVSVMLCETLPCAQSGLRLGPFPRTPRALIASRYKLQLPSTRPTCPAICHHAAGRASTCTPSLHLARPLCILLPQATTTPTMVLVYIKSTIARMRRGSASSDVDGPVPPSPASSSPTLPPLTATRTRGSTATRTRSEPVPIPRRRRTLTGWFPPLPPLSAASGALYVHPCPSGPLPRSATTGSIAKREVHEPESFVPPPVFL